MNIKRILVIGVLAYIAYYLYKQMQNGKTIKQVITGAESSADDVLVEVSDEEGLPEQRMFINASATSTCECGPFGEERHYVNMPCPCPKGKDGRTGGRLSALSMTRW